MKEIKPIHISYFLPYPEDDYPGGLRAWLDEHPTHSYCTPCGCYINEVIEYPVESRALTIWVDHYDARPTYGQCIQSAMDQFRIREFTDYSKIPDHGYGVGCNVYQAPADHITDKSKPHGHGQFIPDWEQGGTCETRYVECKVMKKSVALIPFASSDERWRSYIEMVNKLNIFTEMATREGHQHGCACRLDRS